MNQQRQFMSNCSKFVLYKLTFIIQIYSPGIACFASQFWSPIIRPALDKCTQSSFLSYVPGFTCYLLANELCGLPDTCQLIPVITTIIRVSKFLLSHSARNQRQGHKSLKLKLKKYVSTSLLAKPVIKSAAQSWYCILSAYYIKMATQALIVTKPRAAVTGESSQAWRVTFE